MFQDKEMVSDYLAGLNASLTGYAHMISESNNSELRQTLIQMRNQDESRQRTMYSYALQKGYYQPAAPASDQVIQQLKSQLMQGQ
ncbi:coat F domain-containing protein [Schinkia azotoformans MEV2011]|uniref:Coat F domain-containing protein n=1 Tax=Schinkia azotoformans MEV2011 TaxID=1348973 RepID=A0A072NPX7_SCHAZ|nr:spore coat protein [Schinkia azotoformans]KEF35945.1 coat F domain-containing protein [Schinkia azotoformans MEV2011]KEF39714.1 coat F domain-containing protein [Schinkia azotoformans MEV2011]MEC1695067.1 spore coat protein [Schinkia azotoformans]MEC1716325.1 spore coat protein [Schinkia azotoformans]MEC1726872.1 spore coat protein [Schinkia azotoformans]